MFQSLISKKMTLINFFSIIILLYFRLRVLESENMRLTATINTTNRQVDIRLNEIEQRLVDEDSSPEEFSVEEEEKNQESFIWILVTIVHLLDIVLSNLVPNYMQCKQFKIFFCDLYIKVFAFLPSVAVGRQKMPKYFSFSVMYFYYYNILYISFQSAKYNQNLRIEICIKFLRMHFTKHCISQGFLKLNLAIAKIYLKLKDEV